MKIVFATNNPHKITEIQKVLGGLSFVKDGDKIQILSLADIDCHVDIPETQETLEGNASQKSFYVYDNYGYNCFADDTGLEIKALDGRPGVYSARYAGSERSFEKNMDKVLEELNGKSNRKARFRTVISLIIEGKEYLFEGIVNGTIIEKKRGELGFGYDPIFVPDGFDQTFAEMDLAAKNEVSHRARAVLGMTEFLREYLGV